MTTIPIGLQLYSVREDCRRDLPGTLAAVAKMGYAGVEFAGYYERTARELRQMLDDSGLQCCGTHNRLEQLMGDNLHRTVEFNLELGNKYLIVASVSQERSSSRSAWLETAHLFNEAAANVEPHSMQVGYHNHETEFEVLEGEVPFDVFFSHTLPSVIMQLDTGNALYGGADPGSLVSRYPGRAITVHLKDFIAATHNLNVVLGDGDTPWQDLLDLCQQVGGTQWYIVEQECSSCPPLECVDRSLQALRQMGR